MPKMTKERLEMFSDAVMAILLTLMALDLPVQLDAGLNLPQLVQSIGIYFISFCFIANLWYQHVFLLYQSDTVENSVVLLEFLMLFFLSLIPSFTRTMIQDIEQVTVLLYGIVYMLINVLLLAMRGKLIAVMRNKEGDNTDVSVMYRIFFNRHGLFVLSLYIANLVIAWFQPKLGLLFYILPTILSFFLNGKDKKDFDEISRLPKGTLHRFVTMTEKEKQEFQVMYARYIRTQMGMGAGRQRRKLKENLLRELEERFHFTRQEAVLWYKHSRRFELAQKRMRKRA